MVASDAAGADAGAAGPIAPGAAPAAAGDPVTGAPAAKAAEAGAAPASTSAAQMRRDLHDAEARQCCVKILRHSVTCGGVACNCLCRRLIEAPQAPEYAEKADKPIPPIQAHPGADVLLS